MSDSSSSEDNSCIQRFFSPAQWEEIDIYERRSFRRQKENFERMVDAGLNPKLPPLFMRGKVYDVTAPSATRKQPSLASSPSTPVSKAYGVAEAVPGTNRAAEVVPGQPDVRRRPAAPRRHPLHDEDKENSGVCGAAAVQEVDQNQASGLADRTCRTCGKTFRKPYKLKQHLRVHTGEKPFECSQCGMRFAKKWNLTLHEHSHSTEKNFLCSYCGSFFSRLSDLHRHERQHTGEKPFECQICSASFRNSGNLRAHERTHVTAS